MVIPKSEFVRNVLTLISGASIAQIIPLAVSPFLTRLYAPEDFGSFAFFLSIVSIGGVLSTGMYEAAIVLPTRDREAINIMALCGILSILIFLLSLIGIFFFQEQVLSIIGSTIPVILLYLMPIFIFLFGIFQTLTFWAIRKKRFRRLAVNKVSQNLVIAGSNLGLGVLGFGLIGFVISHLVGQVVANLQLFLSALLKDNLKIKVVSKERIWKNSFLYRDFPKISLPQVVLDTLQASALFFIIQHVWGATELGFYAFMIRILKTPLTLIGTSIGHVFYQRSSQAYNSKEDLNVLLRKTMRNLFIMGAPVFITAFFFSPFIFRLVFGEKWGEAGVYAQILTPWLFVNFIYSPVSHLPLTLGKQKQNFLIGLAYNGIILSITAIMGYLGFHINTTFVVLSTVLTIFLLLVLNWLLAIAKEASRDLNKITVPYEI